LVSSRAGSPSTHFVKKSSLFILAGECTLAREVVVAVCVAIISACGVNGFNRVVAKDMGGGVAEGRRIVPDKTARLRAHALVIKFPLEAVFGAKFFGVAVTLVALIIHARSRLIPVLKVATNGFAFTLSADNMITYAMEVRNSHLCYDSRNALARIVALLFAFPVFRVLQSTRATFSFVAHNFYADPLVGPDFCAFFAGQGSGPE